MARVEREPADSLIASLAPAKDRTVAPTNLTTFVSAAPADASLSAGQMVLWLDKTPGATKLMIKAKDSGGTVRTGSVALT